MTPPRDTDKSTTLFEAKGRTSTSYLSLGRDLDRVFFGEDGFMAYRERLGVRVVPGDPVASPRELEHIAVAVHDGARSGRDLVLFACDTTTRDVFEEHGFSSLYIGCEPVVDIDAHSLAGRRRRGLRGSVARAARGDLVVTEYEPASGRVRSIEDGLRRVSTEWCRTKGTPELNFLVGRLDFEETYGKRYFVCNLGGGPVAYILLYPVPATGDVYLDHMRRLPGSPKECLDFTLSRTLDALRAEDVGRMFMGVCPFSMMAEGDSGNPKVVSRVFGMLQRPFGLLYPAVGEYHYKRKWATSWEPRYMCYSSRVSARLLLAILDCFCPGGLPAIVLHKSKRFMRGLSGRARGGS